MLRIKHEICVYKFLARSVGHSFLLSLKLTFNLYTQDFMASKNNSTVVVDVVVIWGKKKASGSSGSSTAISKPNRKPPVTRNKTKSRTSYLVESFNHHGKKHSTKKNPSHETSSQEKILPVKVVSPLPEVSEDISFWLSDAHSSTRSRSGSYFGSPSWGTVYTSSQSYSIVMPVMMIGAATIDEQLVQMTTVIAKLTKIVEEKDL